MTDFCQSCLHVLTVENAGTTASGEPSAQYCSECMKEGLFTSEITLNEMVEKYLSRFTYHPSILKGLRRKMTSVFKRLLRWR